MRLLRDPPRFRSITGSRQRKCRAAFPRCAGIKVSIGMQEISHRPLGRKYPARVKFVGVIGCRRRYRWSQPFSVVVFKLERMAAQ